MDLLTTVLDYWQIATRAIVGGMIMNVVVKAMGGGFAAALAATVCVAALAFAVGTVPFLVLLVKRVRR